MKREGLRAKILRVYAVQVLLIGLAILLGIYISNSIVQDVLMRSALDGEANHFWSLYEDNPDQALPNTDNLVGYLAHGTEGAGVPESIRYVGQTTGYHRGEFDGDAHIVHVSKNGNATLYLVFDNNSVSELALFFGIVPLSIVLLLVYGFMFFAYRMSQRAVSPIVKLANYLEDFQIDVADQQKFDLASFRDVKDAEVALMVEALDHFTKRVDAFVERERQFTRDASHELRTPVAVFKASLDLLERDKDRSLGDVQALVRMRKTVNDMEGLIETLLVLAAESAPNGEVTEVNAVARGLLEQMLPLAEQRNNRMTYQEFGHLKVRAPNKVVLILLTNLVRNAISYTKEGSVELLVGEASVKVVDTGQGMSQDDVDSAFKPFHRGEAARNQVQGYGLGLAIVNRLVEQFSWRIDVTSAPGEGTTVEIWFDPN